MLIVPLQAAPNQRVNTVLANQSCTIVARQKRTGIFLDLYVDDVAVVLGAICQNANPVVVSAYLGFIGDLAFFDTQGSSDPVYTGIATRFFLVYLESADLGSA